MHDLVVEVLRLAVTLLLLLGLLWRPTKRAAGIAVAAWSAVASVLLVAEGRWGWAGFYAICGFGGLVVWLLPSRRTPAR